MIRKILTDTNSSLDSRSISENSLENGFSIQKESLKSHGDMLYSERNLDKNNEKMLVSLVDDEELLGYESFNIMSDYIQDSKPNSSKHPKLHAVLKEGGNGLEVLKGTQKHQISYLMGSTLEEEELDGRKKRGSNLKEGSEKVIKAFSRGNTMSTSVTLNKFEESQCEEPQIKSPLSRKELHKNGQKVADLYVNEGIEAQILRLKQENELLMQRNKILIKEKNASKTVYEELQQRYRALGLSLNRTNSDINQSVVEFEEEVSKEIRKENKSKTKNENSSSTGVSFVPLKERLKKLRQRIDLLK